MNSMRILKKQSGRLVTILVGLMLAASACTGGEDAAVLSTTSVQPVLNGYAVYDVLPGNKDAFAEPLGSTCTVSEDRLSAVATVANPLTEIAMVGGMVRIRDESGKLTGLERTDGLPGMALAPDQVFIVEATSPTPISDCEIEDVYLHGLGYEHDEEYTDLFRCDQAIELSATRAGDASWYQAILSLVDAENVVYWQGKVEVLTDGMLVTNAEEIKQRIDTEIKPGSSCSVLTTT